MALLPDISQARSIISIPLDRASLKFHPEPPHSTVATDISCMRCNLLDLPTSLRCLQIFTWVPFTRTLTLNTACPIHGFNNPFGPAAGKWKSKHTPIVSSLLFVNTQIFAKAFHTFTLPANLHAVGCYSFDPNITISHDNAEKVTDEIGVCVANGVVELGNVWLYERELPQSVVFTW